MSEKKVKAERKAAKRKAPPKNLRSDLMEILRNFYEEERGNRVTTNNVDGLMGKVSRAIVPYERKDKEVPDGKIL